MKEYVVVWRDAASADRDRAYLARSRHDPEQAVLWINGLVQAVSGLTRFPGPFSWAVDEPSSVMFGREVRRLLYYGPGPRRTGIPVRVLSTVLPPDPSAPED